jgi:hypothetical protein
MGELVNKDMKHTSFPFVGSKGDDSFFFTIPPGDVFDRVELEVSGFDSGARIDNQPNAGQTGELAVNVHWWVDSPGPPGMLWYTVKVYSKWGGRVHEVPGRILLFEHINFEGRFKEINDEDHDLTQSDDGFFNDLVSSIVVLKGTWSIFRDVRYETPYLFNGNPVVLGPGMYSNVSTIGLENDDMSSLLAVNSPENHP